MTNQRGETPLSSINTQQQYAAPSSLLQKPSPVRFTAPIIVQASPPSKKERRQSFLSGVGMITVALASVIGSGFLIARYGYKKKLARVTNQLKAFLSDDPKEGGKKLASLMKVAVKDGQLRDELVKLSKHVTQKSLTPELKERLATFAKELASDTKTKEAIQTLVSNGVGSVREQGGLLGRMV